MEEVADASNAAPVVLVLQADNMGAAMRAVQLTNVLWMFHVRTLPLRHVC